MPKVALCSGYSRYFNQLYFKTVNEYMNNIMKYSTIIYH